MCKFAPIRCTSHSNFVIARGEAPRQSRAAQTALDCFAALAMTKGGGVTRFGMHNA